MNKQVKTSGKGNFPSDIQTSFDPKTQTMDKGGNMYPKTMKNNTSKLNLNDKYKKPSITSINRSTSDGFLRSK